MTKDVEKIVRRVISKIIEENTGMNTDDIELKGDLSLIGGGFLDSLSIVEVVQSLQKEFGVKVTASDVSMTNFNTIDLIVKFVKECIDRDKG